MSERIAADPWGGRLGFWWIAEDNPDLPAIVASPDGSRTYGDLAVDAHQLVHLFRSLGLGTGDCVGVIADNGNTLVEVSLASQEGGFWFIPLNTHLTGRELAAIMADSGCKVLVLGERFGPLLTSVHAKTLNLQVLTIGHVDGVGSLADARASHPRTEPADRQAGGVFVYTSGTTGKPKGIR